MGRIYNSEETLTPYSEITSRADPDIRAVCSGENVSAHSRGMAINTTTCTIHNDLRCQSLPG